MIDLYPEFFRRIDERPDALFYERPRTAPHLNEAACSYVRELHDRMLPATGSVLDLMAGTSTRLTDRFASVTGLGLNAQELAENPRLTEAVVFDVNLNEDLPFENGRFAAAVCVSSVQYMTRPNDTFAAVARCLAPGAPFVVSFSNRMFPTKAVLAWRASDDAAHVRLVECYFRRVEGFGPVKVRRYVPPAGDPVYTVWAHRNGPEEVRG